MSLIVSLYLFEGYLTYNNQINKSQFLKKQIYKKQNNKKWDNRSAYKLYRDLKKNDNNVSMEIGSNYFEIDNVNKATFSGIENSLIVSCNENGYYSTFFSDRYGFNNPDTEWDKKTIEYFIVGDSFAKGQCVNRPNDIASVIRTLSNKSVLNLGSEGAGPLSKYAILREYLKKDTKKVIWLHNDLDLYDLNKEIKNTILVNYLNNLNFNQNLKLKKDIINEKKLIYHQGVEKFLDKKVFNFVKLYKLRKFIKLQFSESNFSNDTKASLIEFKKILELVKNLVINNNSKLYLVYLPLYKNFQINYDNSDYKLVRNIVNELNITFIDLDELVFKKEENPLKLFPFQMNGHYNIDGYKKVSEVIYKLSKN